MSLLPQRKTGPLNGGALFVLSFMLDACIGRTADRCLSVTHVTHGARELVDSMPQAISSNPSNAQNRAPQEVAIWEH
jgi:hypothetical protein